MGVAEYALGGSHIEQSDLVAYGREVIEVEAAALAQLANVIDDRFAQAVMLILSLRGRVITTGIGKSGYIARKFAATLASTGAPAFFIHPAEAAHGDLGMLVAGDALFCFSNSGNTTELQPILSHAVKLGVPIVGIAGKMDSLLIRHANIGLLLPNVGEACPANLAPTTSTVMMLAMADALAMAAMRTRGVSRAGFEALHPGGTIGRRLMRVTAIMHQAESMPIVHTRASMREVIVTMTAKSFGIAGVVDDRGSLVGVVTDGDLRRNLDGLMEATAGDVMTLNPVWIAPGAFLEDALTTLNQHKITSMFVVEDEILCMPVGLIHVHDLLRMGVG
jgi:arabinose-5-phosphate isomerase